MRYHLVAAICLLCIACMPSNTLAAPIGSVSDAKGNDCSIERGKNKLSGVKGAEIESLDAYVTGGCASSITFRDDTKVKITENSRLVIDSFVFDPNSSSSGKLGLKVGMGTVRFASGQIEKNNPQQVAIETPTATIAVRGTDFTMTVDEAGQSLVVLLPSCKDPRDVKTYELEEQRCKVGQIQVTNSAGTVTLDQAFHGTYVANSGIAPTPPVIVNIIESKINNNLIIVKPLEIQRVYKEFTKTKQEREQEELEMDAMQLERKARAAAQAAEAALIRALMKEYAPPCDYVHSICVKWDNPDQADVQTKGKGIGYRETPSEHYAEVKTQGYSSNTSISITQNDTLATYVIGDGSPGGNVVNIKQSTGVLKK